MPTHRFFQGVAAKPLLRPIPELLLIGFLALALPAGAAGQEVAMDMMRSESLTSRSLVIRRCRTASSTRLVCFTT